jgi:hypothetical protein
VRTKGDLRGLGTRADPLMGAAADHLAVRHGEQRRVIPLFVDLAVSLLILRGCFSLASVPHLDAALGGGYCHRLTRANTEVTG